MFFGPIGKTRWPPWPLIGWDIFDFSSETAEQNLTKLDRKQDLNVLYKVCVFFGPIGKTRWPPWPLIGGDIFRLLWNRWTEFKETWQEARSQGPLQSLCFSGRSEKQDGRPCLWFAETFSTSPLKPLNGIWQNLTGIYDLNVLYQVCVFGPIGKTRWPPWSLIGWDIFDFSSETAEQNSTKLDRKKDFKCPLPSLCFSGRSEKTRWPPLPLIGLRHFRLLLWNRLTGIWQNLTGIMISTSSTKFVFLGRSEKQDGRPGLWLAETFSTSPLKPLNRNSTKTWQEERFKCPLPSLCFSGWSEKTRWPPLPLIGWDIFDFSSETA